MREILFRGKRKDNGALETGSLVIVRGGCSDEQVFITDKMTGYCTPVIPETVGQYTGLTDKNGKLIFEGDILKGSWNTVLIVFYDDISASYRVKTLLGSEREISYYGGQKHLEIIGNIHDNPELLKGAEQ